jgi:hypothetical protein
VVGGGELQDARRVRGLWGVVNPIGAPFAQLWRNRRGLLTIHGTHRRPLASHFFEHRTTSMSHVSIIGHRPQPATCDLQPAGPGSPCKSISNIHCILSTCHMSVAQQSLSAAAYRLPAYSLHTHARVRARAQCDTHTLLHGL